MAKFDYGAYFGPITPLADALRDSPTRFWESTPEKLAQPHEYVLYLGCNVLRTMHLAEAIVAVLKALNVDFVTLGGPSNCCGIVHQRNGDLKVSTQLTQHTLDKFTQVQPKAVLMYCPSCHSHIDGALPKGELDFDVPYLHVTQFIAERLGQLNFRTPIRRRIALHAHEGLPQQKLDTDYTRAILRAIPGLEIVDLPVGAEWGRACSESQIKAMGRARHDALVAEMFAAAKAQACDGIVAVYHSCYREILPKEREHGLEWLNYVELVAASLELGPFPARFKDMKLAEDPDAAYAALAPRMVERRGNLSSLRRSVDAHFAPESSGVEKPKG